MTEVGRRKTEGRTSNYKEEGRRRKGFISAVKLMTIINSIAINN